MVFKEMLFNSLAENGTSEMIVRNAFLGGALGFFVALSLFILMLFILGLYLYTSAAWYTIAQKLKHRKPWLAWIPIANLAMMLQMGGFHWAWIFLILIPILGWIALFVLVIIATWRIFEKRKYPGWFSLSILIPQGIGLILYLVVIGFVAWKDKR